VTQQTMNNAQLCIDRGTIFLTIKRLSITERCSQRKLARCLNWSRSTVRRLLEANKRVPNWDDWLWSLSHGSLRDWDQSAARMNWYPQIPHLLMVGTPPWGPDDFVNVYPNGTLWIPRGPMFATWRPVYHKVSRHDD
jgi:hypothetical protein